ncbi:hypothetical protein LWM68_23260 [Niabella sp. W65]|nr:hypothetical protein [Niabella sp. W65]MCH7365435.1 hypothetical protein [Niabella sp. W65]ULT41225.1 hypothetical protein KRR40_42150 [Niabella sp. I65]
MAGKVNSIGDAKGAGFMVGIAVMAPLFILLRLLRPLVTIDIDARKLTIKQKGRQDMMVHFNAIDRIELNAKKLTGWIYMINNITYLHTCNHLTNRKCYNPLSMLLLKQQVSILTVDRGK